MIKQERVEKYNNLILSSLFMIPAYLGLMEYGFGVRRDSFLAVYMVSVFIVVIANAIVSRVMRLNTNCIGLTLLLTIQFLISFIMGNFTYASYSVAQFGFYVIVPAYCIAQKYNVEIVLRNIIYFSIPLLVVINKALVITNVGLGQADMYEIYAYLPCVLCSLTHFVWYRKKANIAIKIGYIVNLYFFVTLAAVAVRGFWVALFFYVILLFFYYIKKRLLGGIYYFVLILCGLMFFICLYNWSLILGWIVTTLQEYTNMEVSFLIKTSRYLADGNISNGRMEIWESVIDYIISSPIWGYGIESAPKITNGYINYPHNSILQLLLDGGLLFGMLPSALAIIGLIKTIQVKFSEENQIFAVFITSVGLSISLLSGDAWKSATLWLSVFFFARQLRVR